MRKKTAKDDSEENDSEMRMPPPAAGEDTSSSEEEPEWTADDEKAFLKTLGALKGKKQDIYDDSKRFWNPSEAAASSSSNPPTNAKRSVKDKKEKPMFLKDYERKLVLEKGGQLDEDSDPEDVDMYEENTDKVGYFEQQDEIRKQLRQTVGEVDDSDDDGLLVKREKSSEQKKQEDADFYDWLKTQDAEGLQDKELAMLKQEWEKPDLDDEERFLRDYLLEKKFEPEEKEAVPTYDEIVALEEDEQELERQADYEQKYNFRFENPDKEFIKQFPRTVAESLRKDNTKRKEKREERKERKAKEKQQKIQELKQLKREKKTQIEKKLEKLKRLAGDDIAVRIDDINGDFDPADYDRRMEELFNEEYYGKEGDAMEDMEKPVFSDDDLLDDDEDFDNMVAPSASKNVVKKKKITKKGKKATKEQQQEEEESGEDEDGDDGGNSMAEREANEDEAEEKAACENQEEGEESLFRKSESRRKLKRKSKLTEALEKKKPLFDPKEKTFEEYFNEYYALDYEDIIAGDQVTRFKYREVVPNDFGLSTKEILSADDKQLNAWASIKKATAYRADHEEQFDIDSYKRKAQNTKLKKRFFEKTDGEADSGEKKKKKKKKEKAATATDTAAAVNGSDDVIPPVEGAEPVDGEGAKKKKKRRGKRKHEEVAPEETPTNFTPMPNTSSGGDVTQSADAQPAAKKARTRKRKPAAAASGPTTTIQNGETVKKGEEVKEVAATTNGTAPAQKKKALKQKKKKAPAQEQPAAASIADDRLKAYGINPKRFKAKLKYGKPKGDGAKEMPQENN